jgi:rRNA maturation RNase YbeY
MILMPEIVKRNNLIESQTIAEWKILATSRLGVVLKLARSIPKLGAQVGLGKSFKMPWTAEVALVNKQTMLELNSTYRKKNYPTDVLSFPAPAPFVKQGMLGELILCLPVLKAQAKEVKHPPQSELDVLLVHGVLHLLGFDHERGLKEASAMARWEIRLLEGIRAKTKLPQRGLGLIERSNSGKESK